MNHHRAFTWACKSQQENKADEMQWSTELEGKERTSGNGEDSEERR